MADGAHAGPLFGAPVLPGGPFRCILADPPWQMKMWSEKGMDRSPDGKKKTNEDGYYIDGGANNSPERHYKTMSIADLMSIRVSDSAADDCVLLLWAIDSMLAQAITLGEAWGFTYKTVGFYWAKLRSEGSERGRQQSDWAAKLFPMGTGYWTRANPEQCLLFTRGAPKRLSKSVRRLIVAPRREHSRKPDEQYPAIEALCAGPRLELFARTERPGWTAWGAETTKFAAT